MKVLIRILDAERLKLRRTLALWMAFVAPLSVVFYIVVAFLVGGEEAPPPSHENVWDEFSQVVSIFWALLMLPLFVTLQTALLGGLEHRNAQWKHLCALPIPRWAIVLAKQILAAGLMALSHAALVAFAVAGLPAVAAAARSGFSRRDSVGGVPPAGGRGLSGLVAHPGHPYLGGVALAQLCGGVSSGHRADGGGHNRHQ